MKRVLTLSFSILILAFAALIWLRRSTPSRLQERSPVNQSARATVRAFWDSYHRATQLRTKGSYRAALPFYQRALRLQPQHQDSLYYLANCWMELGEYEQAERLFRRLLRLNPASQRGLSQLGVLLSTPVPGNRLRLGQAASLFSRVIEINREQTIPYLHLGRLALGEHQLEKAFRYFQTAAGFHSFQGYYYSGFTRFRQGRYQQAETLLQQVLAMARRERRISKKGSTAEGDAPRDSSRIGPLEMAVLKSRLLLAWSGQGGSAPLPAAAARGLAANRFLRRTAVPDPVPGGGCRWVDFDGDGRLDLSASGGFSGLRLYRNVGGRLRDVTRHSGLDPSSRGWDLSWGDYDRDGDLDLFLAGAGFWGAAPSRLYRQQGSASRTGRGFFQDATAEAGLSGLRDSARAAFWDYNGDGWPDLLLVGSGTSGLRLLGNQRGRFTDVSREMGLQLEGIPVETAFGDVDSDGREDLLVLRWKRSPLLFLNRKEKPFQEVSAAAGLGDLGGISWAAVFLDYDRDGKADLLLGGWADDEETVPARMRPPRPCRNPLRLLRNTGGRFLDVSQQAGLGGCYGTLDVAAADLEGDGWTDLVLANGDYGETWVEPSVVFRNRKGHFLETDFLVGERGPVPTQSVAAADFDGDGRAEIFLGENGLYWLPDSRARRPGKGVSTHRRRR